MRSLLLVAFLLVVLYTKSSVASVGLTELKCGSRIYNLISPSIWKCCGGSLYPKKSNFFACCDKKCYSPMSQYCCGKDIYPRLNANSACCDGRSYQRGTHGCCGNQVIDLKTHDCCRNGAYDMKKQMCCDGERLVKDSSHNRTECCGKRSHDPLNEMCCAEKVVRKTAGEHSKCCEMSSYDSSTKSCCMGKIIPRDADKNECCNGIMINNKVDVCCGGEVKPRPYNGHTGCCRIGKPRVEVDLFNFKEKSLEEKLLGGIHLIYDKSLSICCSGKLSFKKDGGDTGCCAQKPYNVKTHICCLDQIYKRKANTIERCCKGKSFDRTRHICCHGNLHEIVKSDSHFKYCCGKKVYDRRMAQCDVRMKLTMYECEDPIYIYGKPGKTPLRKV